MPMQAIERVRQWVRYGRAQADAGGLPLMRQWLEIAALLAMGGNGPGYYYLAGFARPEIDWSAKCAHLGERAYLRAVRRLNDSRYAKLSQHKLSEKAVLSMMGVPTPLFLGFFHPQVGQTFRHEPLATLDDLDRFVQTSASDRFCIKLAEGSGGAGFQAFQRRRDRDRWVLYALEDGNRVEPETLYERLMADYAATGEGLLIEEYLDQHPVLSALSRSSVNSVRLWVVIDPDGRVRHPLAFLRMGRGASLVDNRSRGGLVAPVDVHTGRLSDAFDGYPSRMAFEAHPDTGARINGVELPDWRRALDLGERAVRLFPGISFAGVDIAFTQWGPVLLELNVEPDRTGAAITGVPSGRALFPRGHA